MSTFIHLLPPTIHPMVVHFSIAAVYFAAVAGSLGFIFRSSLYSRLFFALLCMSIFATLATGLAGVVSESYVHASGEVQRILESHKFYGELTGVLLVASTTLQWVAQHRARRVSWPAGLSIALCKLLCSIFQLIYGSNRSPKYIHS